MRLTALLAAAGLSGSPGGAPSSRTAGVKERETSSPPLAGKTSLFSLPFKSSLPAGGRNARRLYQIKLMPSFAVGGAQRLFIPSSPPSSFE